MPTLLLAPLPAGKPVEMELIRAAFSSNPEIFMVLDVLGVPASACLPPVLKQALHQIQPAAPEESHRAILQATVHLHLDWLVSVRPLLLHAVSNIRSYRTRNGTPVRSEMSS